MNKPKHLHAITQSDLVEAMNRDFHYVRHVHRFTREDGIIELVYKDRGGRKKARFVFEHTGEVGVSISEYVKPAGVFSPYKWGNIGYMFYVSLKENGYILPVLDNVYRGELSKATQEVNR